MNVPPITKMIKTETKGVAKPAGSAPNISLIGSPNTVFSVKLVAAPSVAIVVRFPHCAFNAVSNFIASSLGDWVSRILEAASVPRGEERNQAAR